jgi:hypothetical protein
MCASLRRSTLSASGLDPLLPLLARASARRRSAARRNGSARVVGHPHQIGKKLVVGVAVREQVADGHQLPRPVFVGTLDEEENLQHGDQYLALARARIASRSIHMSAGKL